MTASRTRTRLWQAGIVLAVLAVLGYLAWNTVHNLRARGIPSGFDFLWEPAGFDLSESVVPFDADRPYWQAVLAGLLNTLRVALPACVLASLLGLGLGLARMAPAGPLQSAARWTIEVLRNIPLLLQLLVWYLWLAQVLPTMDQPWQWLALRVDKNGLAWVLGTAEGGGLDTAFTLSPEYLALLIGLTVYTAGYVAEIVRAGLQSTPRGVLQAAQALGLKPAQVLRTVHLPLALRLMVPPLGNQYLNIAKNSSLAVVIGYPDVLSIAHTAINQTGRALECMLLIMAIYLTLSLCTAFVINRYNARLMRYAS